MITLTVFVVFETVEVSVEEELVDKDELDTTAMNANDRIANRIASKNQ